MDEEFYLEEDSLYKEVGEKVRAMRVSRGISQEALAEAAGIGRTSITNLERGRQRLLLHTLYRIAARLDVSPAEFMPDLSVVTGEGAINSTGEQLSPSVKASIEEMKAIVKGE